MRKLNHKNYDPIKDCPFEKDSNVPFSFLAEAFDFVSELKGENSQLYKKTILSNMFSSIIHNKPDDLVYVYNFCINKLVITITNLENIIILAFK